MRLTVEATVKDLQAKRESLAAEMNKIDAKIEVLNEVLYVKQPAREEGIDPFTVQKVQPNLSGSIFQFIRQIIDSVDGEFSAAEIIKMAGQAGRPVAPANVYTAMTKLLADRTIKTTGKEIRNGRRVAVYAKR